MDKSLREYCEHLQVLVYTLREDKWPFKEIEKEEIFKELESFARSRGIGLDRNDPQFLSALYVELDKILSQPELTPSLPPNLKELVADLERRRAEVQKTNLKDIFPTLDEQIEALYNQYRQKFLDEIKKLIDNPQLAQAISHQVALQLIKKLPFITIEDYRKFIAQIINQELRKVGAQSPNEAVINNLAENSLVEAKKISIATSQLTELPELKWQSSGVKINPFRKTSALAKKITLAPFFKPFQFLMNLASEPFQKQNPGLFYALKTGVTAELIQEKINSLAAREQGPAPNGAGRNDLARWQKLRDDLIVFREQHLVISFLSRHYFESNYLGKRVDFLKPAAYAKKAFWQVFKKTKAGKWLGKAAAGILTKLGLSTIVGPVGAIIAFWPTIKKYGEKFLKWAGAALGAMFLWAAHYGPVAIAGLVGGLAVGLPFAAKAAVGIFGTVTAALGPAIGGISAIVTFFVVEGAFALGGLGIGIGGQLLWDKIATAASQISLPQAATAGLTQTGIATATKTAASSLGIGLSAVAATTLIVSTINSGAFVQERGEFIPAIGKLTPARPPDKTKHLAEDVIYVLNQCNLTTITQNNWSKAENCLQQSNLLNKELIIKHFRYSVFVVGENEDGAGLQCVGFVRGVMAALGKDLGESRGSAKNFLDPPTPEGFEKNTNMNDVKIGDLVIMKGDTDGHIAIVVDKKDGKIRIAQAFGTTNSGTSGILSIETEVNPVYYDGFLRPK